MRTRVSQAVRRHLKGGLKRLRRFYVRSTRPFSQQELLAVLRSVGVRAGDVLLVHSSYNRFEGFIGKPTDVILAIKEVIGSSGTLLMPTMPFLGTELEYVSQGPVLDVVRTPSRMGLITELFRRSPGVRRSVHPTHPVAIWGANAEAMIANHHLATTPCGRRSPYRRLIDYDGKVLLLGTGIRAMTLFHAIEEEIEREMPFSPFTRETFSLQCKDANGTIVVTQTRLFDATWSSRRNLNKMVPVLKEHRYWSESSIGPLRVVLLNARDVLATVRLMATQGVYCYDT